MGNSGSAHQQQVTLVEGPPHSWAHSFPRSTSFKVLPDRIPGQRLRMTDNGAILHNGGTISGRKAYAFEATPVKTYRNGSFQNGGADYRKTLYGSEPDLRYPKESRPSHGHPGSGGGGVHPTYYNNNNDNSVKSRIGRSKKKYKAPPAPNVHSADSSSPDSYHRWETSADGSDVTGMSRKSRLFKTRAETKRPSFDNANAASKYQPNVSSAFSQMCKPGAVPGQLQRSLSSPQFQDELTAKLRERAIREPPIGKAADSPHNSPPRLRGREKERGVVAPTTAVAAKRAPSKAAYYNGGGAATDANVRRPQQVNGKARKSSDEASSTTGAAADKNVAPRNRNAAARSTETSKSVDDAVGRAKKSVVSRIPSRTAGGHVKSAAAVDSKKTPTEKPCSAPVKKFYFGMETNAQSESTTTKDAAADASNEVVDKFAAALRKSRQTVANDTSPSESYSSDPTTNDDNAMGISLKLRPTLPRKQLDIPRFSPTAAWRLLSALESPIHSEEDDVVMIEEQIPHPHGGHQLLNDKSGDSGISGDASPQHQDSTHNSQIAWTPQQDLEETSSDGGLESAPVSPESIGTAKFSPRFSLSLPRDERLPTYSCSDKLQTESYPSSSFQNMKKIKRSVSGALGGRNKGAAVSSLDENWLLSRSVPNLFHNSYANRWSDTSRSSADQDDDQACSSKPPSFSCLANGGRIMYLPEYKNTTSQRERKSSSMTHMSKSCEDLSPLHHDEQSSSDHEEGDKRRKSSGASSGCNSSHLSNLPRSSKNRKFTFQSTIRQIERRRIAEKLSKEAEEKERRRLRELEAMKKVEEEFQRKREREKADIRQQLRLYNLTEGGREQPDGAVVPPPAPGTQILSEFRQPRRDYRDYTSTRSDVDSISHSDSIIKKETVHPQVVYKMPKNAQVYVSSRHAALNGNGYHSRLDSMKSCSSDNYRKDFAQGALPRSVGSSDSELSQPNTRPTSRMKQRSRSISPAADCATTNVEPYLSELENLPAEDYDDCDGIISNAEEMDEGENNFVANIENLAKMFNNETVVSNKITLQPFNRNKTYKPVAFKPFSDKIAQVTS